MLPIRRRILLCLCISLVLAGSSATTAHACGPFHDEVVYQYDQHPDFPLKLYASGKLGVVGNAYARSYLVVAYRYLTGKPLSANEQKSVLKLWHFRLGAGDTSLDKAAENWEREQNAVLVDDGDKPQAISDYTGGSRYYDYLNCSSDAFEFASRNLRLLSTKYGAHGKEVKEWVRAQREVFCNCSTGYGKKVYAPGDLPKNSSAELRAYRAYQVASAHFYAGDFNSAIKEFNAISSDSTSPFREIAPYLVVRCKIRKATLAEKNNIPLLQEASGQLRRIMNTTKSSVVKEGGESTSRFLKLHLNPRTLMAELASEICTGKGADFGNQVYYYTSAFDKVTNEDPWSDVSSKEEQQKQFKAVAGALRDNDLCDWIAAMRGPDREALSRSYTRWSASGKVHWLLSTLIRIPASDSRANALLVEAAKVKSDSPAYLSISQAAARVMIEKGRLEQARVLIDPILKRAELSPSTRNSFVSLRLRASRDFAELSRLSLQSPAGVLKDMHMVPEEFGRLIDASKYPALRHIYDPDALYFYNNAVPLVQLKTLADDSRLPPALRADVLQCLWIRAVLLNNALVATSVATPLMKAAPATKAEVNSWLNAKSPPLRRFCAAYTMLKNPGMRPTITYGYGREQPIDKIDDYQDNFWPQGSYYESYEEAMAERKKELAATPPVDLTGCLTASERDEGARENAALQAIGAAPDFLCQAVLAAARDVPGDPRIAEALHLAVKSTRFGLKSQKTSVLSKECFQLLQRKYSRTGWAQKTKFWY